MNIRILRGCLIALVCWLLVSSAFAFDAVIDDALKDANAGHGERAVELLWPLAKQGDQEAWRSLGAIVWRVSEKGETVEAAEKRLRESALQGKPLAQLKLGLFLSQERNPEGVTWLRRVAEEHPTEGVGILAMAALGDAYRGGLGVPPDEAEARRWTLRGAEQDDPRAQLTAGIYLLDGRGGPKDVAAAIKWMQAAARQKFAIANYALVFTYAEGFETKPDAMESAYWLTGRRMPEREAAYALGKFYSKGFRIESEELILVRWLLARRGVPKETIRAQSASSVGTEWKDPDQALRWYRASAEGGFVGGQVELGRFYWSGDTRYWNCAEAVKWTRRAADEGDATAMVNMGLFYSNGGNRRTSKMVGIKLEPAERGVRVREVIPNSPAEKAGFHLADEILSVNGEDVSSLGLAPVLDILRTNAAEKASVAIRIRRNGKELGLDVTPEELNVTCPGLAESGLSRDPQKAVEWFRKAADIEDPTGLFYLAQAYEKGTGLAQDPAKAMELFKKAADHDDWEAAQEVSIMYRQGIGCAKDTALAEQWYRRALSLKHKAVGR